MKFKKEDMGLYLAFILVGAGLGILTGSVLASYLKKKEAQEVETAKKDEEVAPDLDWGKKQRLLIEKELNEKRKTYEKEDWVVPKKEEPKKKPRKVNKKHDSPYTEEELKEFAIEYKPNVFQMAMLENGSMTMEQVKGVIEEERLASEIEDIDYGAQYRSYFENAIEEAKELNSFSEEEIKELVNEIGIINNRFRVTTYPPTDTNLRLREIQWDSHDNGFYFLRQGHVMPYSIDTSIGHDAWEEIVTFMKTDKLTDVYVEDIPNGRVYLFHKLADLGEDEPLTPEDYVEE